MLTQQNTFAKRDEKAHPKGYPERFAVPDDTRDWSIPFPGYDPPMYVAKTVLLNDELKHAASSMPEEMPLNPMGRTGIKGRGLLYNWGVNRTGDTLYTRVGPHGKVEILLITRADNGFLALIGGFVEGEDTVLDTQVRELDEEVGLQIIPERFEKIWSGYVDDPRNTDNAWIESTLAHVRHEPADGIPIADGIEVKNVDWYEPAAEILQSLYASHGKMIEEVMRTHPEIFGK